MVAQAHKSGKIMASPQPNLGGQRSATLPFVPVQSVIYKEHRLVVTIEEGRVTLAEMLANQDRLLTDPDFDSGFNQLSDATLATDTDLSANNVRTLYERRVFSENSRRAVVAPTPFTYGMARMLQTYIELSKTSHPVQIFPDRQSALRWLGVSEDFAIPLQLP